jgi:hypothetical protein
MYADGPMTVVEAAKELQSPSLRSVATNSAATA